MENQKKSNNVLLIILMILVLGLGGFIVYDKILKDEKTTTNNDNTSTIEENNDTVQTINSFEIFKDKLMAERSSKFDESKDKSLSYSLNEKTVSGNYSYTISLNKDGDLLVSFYQDDLINKYGNSKVLAHNVLLFNSVYEGNGGMKVLYFVKEDGTVSSIALEANIEAKADFNITDNVGNFKDIINILPGAMDINFVPDGRSNQPLFIDINGNIFTLNY